MVWDWMISCYLFLAGMGAGAFALAAIASFAKPELGRLRTLGYCIAPVVVGIGCLLLMVDARAGLLNPLRLFHIVSNLQSVMAWGVIILCLFIVATLANAALWLFKHESPAWLNGVGLFLSLCTAAYTGVLLGAAPAYPLWNLAITPVLFVVSACGSGFASVILGCYLTGSDDPAKLPLVGKASLVIPVLEAVLIAVLLVVSAQAGGSASSAGVQSVTNLLSGDYAPAFWLGIVVVGLALPFALELLRHRKGVAAGSAVAVGICGEAAVLVGAFMLRLLVIYAAVPVFAA